MDRETPELDLSKLRARLREKPRTKAGQIRQAWPDIRALMEAGHSLKDIWRWLNDIGIEIGYARLSHYTGQLKRRDSLRVETPAELPAAPASPEPAADPLANVRARETRQPGFQFNPEPNPKKLI